jgi:hypothetical protein
MKIDRPAVDMAAARAGDQQAFALSLADFAAGLFVCAGSDISFPHAASHVAMLGDTAKAGQLASAMDLCSLLAKSPHGRKALADFGFQPLFQHVEGE